MSAREVGFPDGVVNVVTGSGADVGARFAADPRVDVIALTGDSATGRTLMAAGAPTLKRLHLELGGKAPLVVLDDADLDDAVNGAAFGCFANSGQICMSTERLIVDHKIADEFVRKFANVVTVLHLGRVLSEAMPNSRQPTVQSKILRSEPDALGNVTVLVTHSADGTIYFDAAGYPGRTLGLPAMLGVKTP